MEIANDAVRVDVGSDRIRSYRLADIIESNTGDGILNALLIRENRSRIAPILINVSFGTGLTNDCNQNLAGIVDPMSRDRFLNIRNWHRGKREHPVDVDKTLNPKILVVIISCNLTEIVDLCQAIVDIRRKAVRAGNRNVGDGAVGVKNQIVAGQPHDLAGIVDARRSKGKRGKGSVRVQKPVLSARAVGVAPHKLAAVVDAIQTCRSAAGNVDSGECIVELLDGVSLNDLERTAAPETNKTAKDGIPYYASS